MTNLSHEQARRWIQDSHLAEEDRLALRQHLVSCDECRAYAALHVHMLRNLPLEAARSRPTAEQRRAILAAAGRPSPLRYIWRPLVSTAGMAALLLFIAGLWLTMRPEQGTRPVVPEALATRLAPFMTLPTRAPTPDPRGRYVIAAVPAPSLAGNAIGEPLEQQVVVYLPPSYDSGDRRYPVVYALISGFLSSGGNRYEQLGAYARSAMNLARQGSLEQEVIVVVLDPINSLNMLNHFVQSPVTGDWESYLTDDLVAYVDGHYRTLPSAESRGLLGEDYHGLPALLAAVNHPDVFSAVYLRQPFVLNPGRLEQSVMMTPIARSAVINLLDEIAKLPPQAGLALMRDRLGDVSMPGGAHAAISYGMAYAAKSEGTAPYFEYPYQDADGQPDPDIWRRWESGLSDLPEKLQPHLETLRNLEIAVSSVEGPAAHMSASSNDPAYLSEQLTTVDVPHAFNVLDKQSLEEFGEDILPFFSEVLASEP